MRWRPWPAGSRSSLARAEKNPPPQLSEANVLTWRHDGLPLGMTYANLGHLKDAASTLRRVGQPDPKRVDREWWFDAPIKDLEN